MTAIDPHRLLELAISHHEQGRFAQAQACYHQVLAQQPANADVLHRLGVLAYQVGRNDIALEYIRQAIANNPRDPDMHNNAALILLSMNQLDQAMNACFTALQLAPQHAPAMNNLGLAMHRKRRFPMAVSAYLQAIKVDPNFAQAYNNLGSVLQDIGDCDQAIQNIRQAIELQPNSRDFHYNLGNALYKKGDLESAIASYQRAISLLPNDAESMINLGNAFLEADRKSEAADLFNRAISLVPSSAEAFNGLGLVARQVGDLDNAIKLHRHSALLKPDFTAAANNLGNDLLEAGQAADAIAVYDQALAADPADAHIHSNRIYCMQFDPAYDTAAICRELAVWNERFGRAPARDILPHRNDRNPDRRLRIGYLSPDLRQHVVGWNLLPLLTHHNRDEFEIYCYSNVMRPDAMTEKLRAQTGVWRDIISHTNRQAADLIRNDKIDILLDLSVHSALHRLQIFALKPAPLAITYLGYCGSTGMSAIDYRFSDPYLDPPEFDSLYAEKTVRLPHTYWCYQPGGNAPTPGSPPAMNAGHITFGCLNNFSKVSSPALELWAEILASIPGSRLILHAPLGGHRQRVIEQMATQGVRADRIEFIARQNFDAYIQTFQRIDIALDPLPYGGGISTCDALWMGVPTISLDGNTAVGRSGKSILSNLGLTELLATTSQQYHEIAVELAADLNRLKTLRATLRQTMKSSPLMDAPAFAKDVEQSYRSLWRQWCLQ